MSELMFDLETLDTKPSAVVLSVGAVIWEYHPEGHGFWHVVDKFMRVLNIQEQVDMGRTISESTLLWWQRQDRTAHAEAFNPVRQPVDQVLAELMIFAGRHKNRDAANPGLNAFWAGPATFDFPIWDDLAMTFAGNVPWSYRQKYDLRTVVREANYSAKDHKYDGPGVPHTPVYDCLKQIDLLTAARQKLGRRMVENSS